MKHISFIILLTCSILSISSENAHQKKALIFGVSGQDGIYLSRFLLKKGYEVHGVQHTSPLSLTMKKYKHFHLHQGNLASSESVTDLIKTISPDEIYNLAAQSNVRNSIDTPEYTSDIDALGVLRILQAIKNLPHNKQIRFYQASTSEMFGKVAEVPQKETTKFQPRSPYGVAKAYGHLITVNYRETYGLFACNGILFNHESPLRGPEFVTRKISRAVADTYHGSDEILYLGNLDVRRDWGYAKDYIKAMWLMLQQDHPDDYVIATGKSHTVREFVELAFKEIGITITWEGKGIDETGRDAATGKVLVKVDSRFFRPTEIDETLGDPTKAEQTLKWHPTTSFQELIQIMVKEDIRRSS